MTYKFILHRADTDWGVKYYIMEESGRGFILAYVYNEDNKAIVLGDLSVRMECRNNGLGLALMEKAERLGNYERSLLWVDGGTWQQKWYERRGYEFHSFQKDEGTNAIWMEKSLINEPILI